MAKDLFDRVADEARPPAVLGRYPGISDYTGDLLLDDLVEKQITSIIRYPRIPP